MFKQLSRMADERLIEMLSVEKDEFLAPWLSFFRVSCRVVA
jgi:hypothetical protein